MKLPELWLLAGLSAATAGAVLMVAAWWPLVAAGVVMVVAAVLYVDW